LHWKAPSSLDSLLTDPHLGQALQGMSRVILFPFHSDAYSTFMAGVRSASVLPSPPGSGVHLKLDVPAGTLDVYLDAGTYLIKATRAVPTRTIQSLRDRRPQAGMLMITYDLIQQAAPETQPLPADTFPVDPPSGATEAVSLRDFYKPPPPKPAHPAPDFTLPSLSGKRKVTLSDLKGRVVLLDFWATWCPYCRAELPVLQGLYVQFSRRGLVMLAVNQAEDRQTVQSFLSQHELDIPVVLDKSRRVAGTYKVRGLPTVYLIGKDGSVLLRLVGYGLDREGQLRKAIVKALAAPAPPR
jgi:peroxiredoxin